MRIIFAADHAGFALKEALKDFVMQELGHTVEDVGAFVLLDGDDFPVYMREAAKRVALDPTARAIILGGSGQGEAMCANREKGVRAAVYYGGALDIIKRSREHNDANVLSLGARFLDLPAAKEAVKLWLETDVSTDPKYTRRNQALDQ